MQSSRQTWSSTKIQGKRDNKEEEYQKGFALNKILKTKYVHCVFGKYVELPASPCYSLLKKLAVQVYTMVPRPPHAKLLLHARHTLLASYSETLTGAKELIKKNDLT